MTKPNVVSFEVAKQLKQCNFPTPPLGNGQFWFDKSGTLHLISEIDGEFWESDRHTGVLIEKIDQLYSESNNAYFAPSPEIIEFMLEEKIKPGKLKPVINTFDSEGLTLKTALDPDAYAKLWLDSNCDVKDNA
jgi:hypothetical protein